MTGMTDPAPTTGLLSHQSGVRALDLGDVRLTYVIDGAMGLLPGVFFPSVPTDYWTSHPEALDAQDRVAMSVGGLLVERDGRALLIDAGYGPYTGDTPMGPVDSGALPETFASLGRDLSTIEAVAFTHLHIDHTGWAFTPGSGGRLKKTFPGARYILAADEWAPHGKGESIPGSSPAPVIEQFAVAGTLAADDEKIFPGVRTVVTPGHSPGHTAYVITSQAGDRVIALGDAFHIPAQLTHPQWSSLTDTDSTAVLASRERLLSELGQPRTTGFALHFGDQAFGRLARDREGLRSWEPVPASLLSAPPRRLD
jgi:glyoxylase-like metal-dependent hydrolase (beta-lactamase superfamily II)